MSLKDIPIRRKLMAIILLTSGAVLLLTCTSFFAYEFLTFRQVTVRQLSTLGEIIAANSTAALAFYNQDDAIEILAALQAEPHIVVASLYDKNGKLFSKYPADLPASAFPAAPEGDWYRFADSYLTTFLPVTQGGERLGTLYLKSDMGAMYERFRLYSGIVVLVIAGSSLVAYMLSRALQRQISHPILALAKTAKAISERRDYSVRATKHSQDELGLLTDAFNQMLTQIDEQDQALSASKERLRLLLSATHRAAWDWDIAANRLWHQEDLGTGTEGVLSNGEGAGAQWLERLHPADRERIAGSLQAFVGGQNDIWAQEYRYRNADGSYTEVLERGVVIRSRGKPVRMLGAVLDISERKRAEEEIRRLNEELEQRVRLRTAELTAANQELEAFSYSVSHDLRAPLRHIHGFSDLLRRQHEAKLDDQGRRYLAKVSDSAQQMGMLIDDLLNFSRIGRAELQHTRVDLRELIEEVRDLLQPEMGGRDIAWAIGELPEVSADCGLLRLVLQNLIGNAVKYSGTRQRAEITIRATRERGEFVISVRDNGVGFDMTYGERLFGVFQRLHSDFEGNGIGLASVRRIILRHGGRVWAEGAVDEGACFYFSLPDELPVLRE